MNMEQEAPIGDGREQPNGEELQKEEDPRVQLNEARSAIEKMKRLLSNNDYRYVQAVIQNQIDARMHRILVRPEGVDDVQRKVYDSGELAGLKIASNFAQILLEGAQGTVVQYSHLIEEDEE